MQQTSKYQFNLVENTDDFSPTPLNQNMEKVEEELEGIEESLTEGLAEVMANLGSGGQNARVAYGSYTGTGDAKTLTFPFKPLLVAVGGGAAFSTSDVFMIWGAPRSSQNDHAGAFANLTWGGSGGSWTVTFSYSSGQAHNTAGQTYYYVAIGCEE